MGDTLFQFIEQYRFSEDTISVRATNCSFCIAFDAIIDLTAEAHFASERNPLEEYEEYLAELASGLFAYTEDIEFQAEWEKQLLSRGLF